MARERVITEKHDTLHHFAVKNLNFSLSVLLSRYCNSHLQVLGLVPKKTRRKKASESHDHVDKESTVNSMRDTPTRADVSSIHGSQDMIFVSPVTLPHRPKKHKSRPPKKHPDIPAIAELKACLETSKRDREDLFSSYGKFVLILVDFLSKNPPET